jgi:hypothetical protein
MGAIDVNLLRIFANLSRQAYQTPILTRGDVRRLEFLFFEDEQVIPLQREDQAKLFLVGPSNQILASATAGPAGVGDSASYYFDLALTTEAISALFSSASTASAAVRMIVAFSLSGRHCTTEPISTELRRNFVSVWDSPPPGPPDLSGRATIEEALGGTENNSWMTPLRTKEAFTALSGNISLNYTPAVSDPVVSTAVGGALAQPASVWRSRTLSQALDTILFPTVPPFISIPKSASLSVSGATGVQEVGSSVARTLTATFNRGRITNGDGSLGPDLVGIENGFPVYSGTGIAPTNNSSLGSAIVVLGSNQWSVTLTHGDGSGLYYDNKNNASTVLNGSRAFGTVTASTTAFTGVYPWYYIKSPVTFTAAQFGAAITALGNSTSGAATNIHASATIAKVVASADGTLSVPYNVSNQFVGVAHDSALTSKTAFFVSALNSGLITVPFKTEETQNSVAQASTAPRWTRNFKVLVSKNPLSDSATTLELRNAL